MIIVLWNPWRTFGVADIGGSYVRGWGLGVSDVRGFERSGLRFVFRHSGFLVFLHFGCSGLNPEHKNPECPKIDHHSLNPEPRTPNVRIWRFVVFGHSGLNPEHPKINPECLKRAPQPPNPEHPKMSPEPRTSENTPPPKDISARAQKVNFLCLNCRFLCSNCRFLPSLYVILVYTVFTIYKSN